MRTLVRYFRFADTPRPTYASQCKSLTEAKKTNQFEFICVSIDRSIASRNFSIASSDRCSLASAFCMGTPCNGTPSLDQFAIKCYKVCELRNPNASESFGRVWSRIYLSLDRRQRYWHCTKKSKENFWVVRSLVRSRIVSGNGNRAGDRSQRNRTHGRRDRARINFGKWC